MRADELMAKLEADPQYQHRAAARQSEAEARAREAEESSRPVLKVLEGMGYRASSVSELPQRYAPLPGPLVNVLLRAVEEVRSEAVLDEIVRALGAAGVQFDGSTLASLFDRTDSQPLKWAIANTLAAGRAQGIGQWVLVRLRDPAAGKAREMLAHAAVALGPSEETLAALVALLAEMPGHAAMALRQLGDRRALDPLRASRESALDWERLEIVKAIRAIEAGE